MPTIDINPTGVRAARAAGNDDVRGGGGDRRFCQRCAQARSVASAGRHAPQSRLANAGQASKGTPTINAPVMFGQLYMTPRLECCLQQWPLLDADCPVPGPGRKPIGRNRGLAVRTGVLPDSSTWW
jgi:hypothetical protein